MLIIIVNIESGEIVGVAIYIKAGSQYDIGRA